MTLHPTCASSSISTIARSTWMQEGFDLAIRIATLRTPA
jgi:hypothetical protein